jgi:hypothetical protein
MEHRGLDRAGASVYPVDFFIDGLGGAIDAGISLIKNPIIFRMIHIGTYVEISQSGYCS